MTPRDLPLVTVVIPTRNRRVLLEEAIESVRRQTYPNWELIVVDDCSTDDTWAWLSSLHDPRIRAFRLDQHSERSVARNRGLAEARGEYILFLDDDDLLTPNALMSLVSPLRTRPAVALAVGYAQPFGCLQQVGWVPWVTRAWEGPLWQQFDAIDWAITGRMLMRASIVRGLQFDPALVPCEDLDLLVRLIGRNPGLRAIFLPQVVLWHRVHTGQSRWQMPNIESWIQAATVVQGKLAKTRANVAGWARLHAASQNIQTARALARRGARLDAFRLVFRAVSHDPAVLRLPLWRKLLLRTAVDLLLPNALISRLTNLYKRRQASIVNARVKSQFDHSPHEGDTCA